MSRPTIPTAKVVEALSSLLQKTEADPLATSYLEICDEANRLAISDIYRILTIKGFSAAQIASADDIGRWNLDMAIYWSLMRSGVIGTSITKAFADSFDRRKEMSDAPAILVGGASVAPAGNDGGGGISSGRLSAWRKNSRKFDRFGGNLFD